MATELTRLTNKIAIQTQTHVN